MTEMGTERPIEGCRDEAVEEARLLSLKVAESQAGIWTYRPSGKRSFGWRGKPYGGSAFFDFEAFATFVSGQQVHPAPSAEVGHSIDGVKVEGAANPDDPKADADAKAKAAEMIRGWETMHRVWGHEDAADVCCIAIAALSPSPAPDEDTATGRAANDPDNNHVGPSDREWLLAKGKAEANQCISVGGLVADLKAAAAAEGREATAKAAAFLKKYERHYRQIGRIEFADALDLAIAALSPKPSPAPDESTSINQMQRGQQANIPMNAELSDAVARLRWFASFARKQGSLSPISLADRDAIDVVIAEFDRAHCPAPDESRVSPPDAIDERAVREGTSRSVAEERTRTEADETERGDSGSFAQRASDLAHAFARMARVAGYGGASEYVQTAEGTIRVYVEKVDPEAAMKGYEVEADPLPSTDIKSLIGRISEHFETPGDDEGHDDDLDDDEADFNAPRVSGRFGPGIMPHLAHFAAVVAAQGRTLTIDVDIDPAA